jgi:hypothetical protein
MMGYYVDDNGKLAVYSGLSIDYDVNEVLQLPEPKGRKFSEDSNSEIKVSFEGLYGFAAHDELSEIKRILEIRNEGKNVKISFEEPGLDINRKQFER